MFGYISLFFVAQPVWILCPEYLVVFKISSEKKMIPRKSNYVHFKTYFETGEQKRSPDTSYLNSCCVIRIFSLNFFTLKAEYNYHSRGWILGFIYCHFLTPCLQCLFDVRLLHYCFSGSDLNILCHNVHLGGEEFKSGVEQLGISDISKCLYVYKFALTSTPAQIISGMVTDFPI